MHSVTFSPVISRCTPPGCVPIYDRLGCVSITMYVCMCVCMYVHIVPTSACTSKKARSSSLILSKGLVLYLTYKHTYIHTYIHTLHLHAYIHTVDHYPLLVLIVFPWTGSEHHNTDRLRSYITCF